MVPEASVNALEQQVGEQTTDHGGALFAGGIDAEKF